MSAWIIVPGAVLVGIALMVGGLSMLPNVRRAIAEVELAVKRGE